MTARRWLGLAIALAALAAVLVLSIGVGTRPIGLGTVWNGLLSADSREGDIVRDGRVPRTILGLEEGAALG